MPWPLQALGAEIIIPGSVTLGAAGTHNFTVPKYRFLRVRMVGASGGSAGITFGSNSIAPIYHGAGSGGMTSFNGVQVTGGQGSTSQSGPSAGAIATGGDTVVNGPAGSTGPGSSSTSGINVPAGANAVNGGAGAPGLAVARANTDSAQGTAPGGGPRGARKWSSRSYEANKNSYTDYLTQVTGGGQAGGYAEKTWQRGQAGAPAIDAVLAAIIGIGGTAGANGGAAGQPGQIILDWW